MVKDTKLGSDICILLKIGKVEMKYGVRQVITIIWVTYVQ